VSSRRRGTPRRARVRRRPTDRVEELLEAAETAAEEPGIRIETDVVIGRPVRELLDYVDEHGIDRVTIGGRAMPTVPRLLLGSVASRVVLDAVLAVTVIRSGRLASLESDSTPRSRNPSNRPRIDRVGEHAYGTLPRASRRTPRAVGVFPAHGNHRRVLAGPSRRFVA